MPRALRTVFEDEFAADSAFRLADMLDGDLDLSDLADDELLEQTIIEFR